MSFIASEQLLKRQKLNNAMSSVQILVISSYHAKILLSFYSFLNFVQMDLLHDNYKFFLSKCVHLEFNPFIKIDINMVYIYTTKLKKNVSNFHFKSLRPVTGLIFLQFLYKFSFYDCVAFYSFTVLHLSAYVLCIHFESHKSTLHLHCFV